MFPKRFGKKCFRGQPMESEMATFSAIWVGSRFVLYYRHEKNPRHHTCLWRVLWKRDIPLHLGGEGKGFISFGADRTDGSLVSRCTTVENDFSPYEVCLVRQMLWFYTRLPPSFDSSTCGNPVRGFSPVGGFNNGMGLKYLLKDDGSEGSSHVAFVIVAIMRQPRCPKLTFAAAGLFIHSSCLGWVGVINSSSS
ncbi:hypothetical protein AVEN_76495-1 [Araneus ventricosus]|uniref:Uncharacterized protein n=1 Tax=Araneus ventricosus TaxID=182803 RepID=A0A4Y2CGI8_ARAVE|nr:hypothetical protein AVEN_76495-1 [Araneus ventricosus]